MLEFEASKDTKRNNEELHLFWVAMNNSSALEPDLVYKRTLLEEKLLLLIQSPNGW